MNANRIDWDKKYELGIEDIDFQHHYFLNLINRMAEELAQSDDMAYRTAVISELNAYARFHFISEENLMTRAGYPGVERHRKHHRDLLDELSSRQSELGIRKSNDAADKVIDFLINWFLSHTAEEDRRFAEYLREPGQ